jgi:hypothetical protein
MQLRKKPSLIQRILASATQAPLEQEGLGGGAGLSEE